ncbi:MAG: acyl-CoA/acyl-ACP dehydrogenase [Candidatus Thermoplasmatota archaeon]|nr:acyl-CoA/acyl-ACP dehydrogenase [Candidatus Thermoplasmatota archaeon]MBU1941049.1 acyl-CoA/acyl-ACP dehydrogenase [Candidatus Thermoplasmatota archaeon]
MDFSWSEEQELWRQTVREFARKNITPHVRDIDSNRKIPKQIMKGMAQLGLLAPTASQDYGGAGVDWTMACIAAEELGRADISLAIPVMYLVEASWGYIFSKYGSEEAKEEYLKRITSGEAFSGIAVTEPEGGSDILGAAKTRAIKKDKSWILNGEKIFISGITESLNWGGIHLTLARTDPNKGHKGFSFFAVPLKNTKGIKTTLLEDMGRMGISTGGFVMNDVTLPEQYLIGELNKGFYYAMEGFSAARVLIGATCIGASEAALELGIDHIKTRKAFGRALGSFEGIQFPLAEHYCNIESVKLLTYRAAWIMDKMYNEQKYTHHDVALAAAMSKLRAPIYAFSVMNEVADWLGATGYTKEYSIEMGIRGVRSYSIGAEGTMNIMRIIIGRELLGKEFLPYGT